MSTVSYWSRTASLPQFPSLTNDFEVDVVIIGGGLTGVTAAYLFKKEGGKIALLERERCAGADTGHTTAHLTYVTDERLHRLVKNFGCDGAKAFWEAGAAAIDQISEIAHGLAEDSEFRWVSGFLHGPLNKNNDEALASLEKDANLARDLGFAAEFLDSVPYAQK